MPRSLLIQADARAIPLADESVDCVVTSPPYWGLRDYGVDEQIGLEASPDCLGWATGEACGVCWVCQMVDVFREVRRVLKPWGTAWVNLGDSYISNPNGPALGSSKLEGSQHAQSQYRIAHGRRKKKPVGNFKHKDLAGLPWRFALAMQAAGWWLRSDIIWHKPNPMPESIKDRPAKAHEYVFLLSKSPQYFYDQEAVREESQSLTKQSLTALSFSRVCSEPERPNQNNPQHRTTRERCATVGRNKRSVWEIATCPRPEAHFATFPPGLVKPCVRAGTSAMGNCPECGRPWQRETIQNMHVTSCSGQAGKTATATAAMGKWAGKRPGKNVGQGPVNEIHTTGWRPTCSCDAGDPVPAVVLDPFIGSGTTARVANELGRFAIGIDLNRSYLTEIAKPYIAKPLQMPLLGAA